MSKTTYTSNIELFITLCREAQHKGEEEIIEYVLQEAKVNILAGNHWVTGRLFGSDYIIIADKEVIGGFSAPYAIWVDFRFNFFRNAYLKAETKYPEVMGKFIENAIRSLP